VALWGGSFVAVRLALPGFTPSGLVAMRMLIGSLLLWALLLSRTPRGQRLVQPDDLPRCILLGLVLGGHLTLQAVGLQYTRAVNTGWIIAVIPALIALGAHLFLHQRMKPIGWLGIALATTGVMLVTASSPASMTNANFGDALQLLSCFTWAFYTLASMAVVARNGALRVIVLSMTVAAPMMWIVAAFQGFQAGPWTPQVLLATGYLAVLCSGLAYLFWFQAMETHNATRVGALLYFEPLFTVVAAVGLLEERVGVWMVFGGAAVMVGVWVVGRAAGSGGERVGGGE
jgi:drug/metabolite transporter (DMT)-like permease